MQAALAFISGIVSIILGITQKGLMFCLHKAKQFDKKDTVQELVCVPSFAFRFNDVDVDVAKNIRFVNFLCLRHRK